MSIMINVNQVSKHFGSMKVIDNCSFSVSSGSITGLIGPNGAGKSTIFNIIAGNLFADSGSITLENNDISELSADQRFHKGLLRTFQIAHEFSHMTTLENLMMVPAQQRGESLWQVWLQPKKVRQQEGVIAKHALEVLDYIGLKHLKNELAGNLSGGQKKLLELGRTIMAQGRVVLLDEVAAGVNRTLLNRLTDNIIRMNKDLGTTFLVIEHDMNMIEKLCSPVIVMIQGHVHSEGSLDQIRNNKEVIEAYFGDSPSSKEAE